MTRARARWWSRLGRWRRGARRLRTTREGRLYIAITIGIGLGAVNTGNNLLYLLLGWLLSLIVASGVLSNASLRGLRVTRRAPPRIHAGRPFTMEIALENRKRRRASYSIEVTDLTAGSALDKSCYFLKVPAGRVQRSRYRHTFHRRGPVRLDGARLATRFPFSLFVKTRAVWVDSELLVYPAVHPVALPAPRTRRLGDSTRAHLGRRGEFYGLRDYRDGDDSRAIHWRSSARTGRLEVRELEEEAQRRVVIELDNRMAADPAADPAALERFERAVSQAASLALAYLRAGYAVALVSADLEVPAAAGPAQEQRILTELARVEHAPPGAALRPVDPAAGEVVRVAPAAAADHRPPGDRAALAKVA